MVATNSSISVQGQASSISVEGLEKALASAERKARRAMSATERKAADLVEWEAAHMDKYPNTRLVPGSVRSATEADLALFASQGRHCHKVVCDIVCLDCGCTWTINAQDAFQVRRCADCQAKVAKAKTSKGSTKVDRATLEAEVARLRAEIATAKGETAPTLGDVLSPDEAAGLTEEEAGDLEVEVTDEQRAALLAQIHA